MIFSVAWKQKFTNRTIRLIEGDATLLRNCASSASDYFSASSSSEIPPIFDKILTGFFTARLVN